jgi:hypothetical protein
MGNKMIEWILKVIDRIISLLSIRARRKKQVFDQLISPTATTLQSIAANYFKIFLDVERRLRAVAPPLRATELQAAILKAEELNRIIDELHEERMQLAPLRLQVQALAKQMGSSMKDESAKQFAHAIENFFFGAFLMNGLSPFTGLLEYLRFGLINRYIPNALVHDVETCHRAELPRTLEDLRIKRNIQSLDLPQIADWVKQEREQIEARWVLLSQTYSAIQLDSAQRIQGP